ncbi:SapC family protein [Telluria aromaticivorans]|uniref:SapC family protein n=1 Tax=Telluria aromaticivorans TaxID=2725995 RepID=A0A7Y2P137_9BURK|nr:SapC family protein [Telluria aromaticivorans]NNG24161.1 SapC family protein [Telluria aromaticivorans]
MANPVLLNNIEHKHLRVITRHGKGLGDSHPYVPTFAGEFRLLQAHYPIVFSKPAEDQPFEPVALFGFENDENLFLNESGWDATVIPLLVERLPFLIGKHGEELMIHIDLDSPRISKTEGEPLFLEHGGMTPYLENINSMLITVHQGMESNAGFVEALVKHNLLESFALDVQLDDGSQHRMTGFHTIHEENLNKLDAATLDSLHKEGYLAAIYFQLASLSNFRALIDRKNASNAAKG